MQCIRARPSRRRENNELMMFALCSPINTVGWPDEEIKQGLDSIGKFESASG